MVRYDERERNYGPTIAVYRAIADDAGRTAELDRDLTDLARRHLDPSGMDWDTCCSPLGELQIRNSPGTHFRNCPAG